MRPSLVLFLFFLPFAAFSQIRIGNCGKWKYIKLNEKDTVSQTCPGDGKNDLKVFSFQPGIPPLHIVVTDTFGNIELVRPFMSVNFEFLKPGFYRVYGLYYPFTYFLKPGKNIFRDTMGSYCYGFTENFVLINNNAPDPGEISIQKGNLSQLICPESGTDMTLQFQTSSKSQMYTYILTDTSNLVFDIQKNGLFDFRPLPSGKYHVHGLAFSGNLQIEKGKMLKLQSLSSNCFSKTIKTIEVERKVPFGGEIALIDEQGSQKYFCTQFASGGNLKLKYTGDAYLNYSFLLMDQQNRIKGVEKVAVIDLNKYPTGSYKIIGISHKDNLPNIIDQPLAMVIQQLKCFEISNNQLEVFIENIKISEFTSSRPNGDSIWCVNAPKSMGLSAVGLGSEQLKVVWVATNPEGTVLAINPNPDSIALNRINEALVRFYAIAYTGNLRLKEEDHIFKTTVSGGCYDISDKFYTVRKKEANGGLIRFSMFNQVTNICLNPNSNYNLRVLRFNTIGEKYIFLMTNARNEIVSTSLDGQFSLRTLSPGPYTIRGLSYTGSLSFGTGSRIDTTVFSNECYRLSDNSLNFQKTITEGAIISFADGQTAARTCKGLKVKSFGLKNNSLVTQKYAYAVTDESGKIMQIEKGNNLQLNDSSLLVYLIRGIAYSGELTAKPGDHISNRTLATGCHSLSQNKLTINFEDLNAGQLIPQKIAFCLMPQEQKNIPINLSPFAGKYAWLICDPQNRLLEVQHTTLPSIKRGLPGRVNIYGFAYLDQPVFQIGKTLSQQNYGISCFELTTSFQEVNWSEIEGGTISYKGQTQDISLCQSELSTPIELSNTGAAELDQYLYLIADKQQKLITTSSTNLIDLKSFQGGNYLIYGLSYSGIFSLKAGDFITRQNSATLCESWSTNVLNVDITGTSVGRISFENAHENVQVCAKKSIQSLKLKPISGNASKKSFLLTNENGKILRIFTTAALPNLDGIQEVILRIYGLGYSGNLTARLDSSVTGSKLSSGCFQLSDNFLTINRGNISGGFVALSNNQTQIQICPTDNTSNKVSFRHIAFQGQKAIYLITNTNNFILDTTTSKSYDFSQQGTGDYRIYGLSYNGDFSGKLGSSINDPSLSDDCFGLSSNYVSVAKRNPTAGFIVMEDANTVLQHCPSDPSFPSRQIKTIGSNGGSQTFVIINALGIIADLISSPIIYPSDYSAGTYKIVAISYNGQLTIKKGDTWGAKDPSTSCFSVTANEVRFLNLEPQGGRIRIQAGDTSNICVGHGKSTPVRFTKDSTNELSYSYLITDEANRYLGHFSDTDLLSFDAFDTRKIKVWGLSHTGKITVNKGDTIINVSLSGGCYQRSQNSITLNLNQFRKHFVTTAQKTDSLFICTGDGQPNLTQFSSSDSTSGLLYKYVLTSVNNNIIQVLPSPSIDLESVGLREMRLYSVAYNGTFTGQNGLITQISLSTGCFRISENFIQIFRDRPLNHSISFSNSDTIQKLCLTKSGSVARLRSSFTGKTGYVYIVLDNTNRIMLLNSSANIDIEKLPDGDYRVFGLSYTGTLNLRPGSIFKNDEVLATSCYRLSGNSVRFYKGGYAEGGSVSTLDASTTLFFCPDDSVPDLIDVQIPNNPIGTRYQFLITDTLNRLVYAPFENQLINFNKTPTGIYKLYGVAFTGTLGFQTGSSILNGSLVNACYDLSDNHLTIYHVKPEGGQISKKDGTTGKTTIVFNNNQKDSILLKVTNASPAQVPYTFVLVNDNNVVIAQSKEKFDADTLKIGRYKIFGMASTNPGLSITLGKSLSENATSQKCQILSTNFLELDIVAASGDPVLNSLKTNLENLPLTRFNTYPNPVEDVVHLQIFQEENTTNIANIRISHLSGKIMLEMKAELTKGYRHLSIPMDTYPPGLYLLTIDSEERRYSGKILKIGAN